MKKNACFLLLLCSIFHFAHAQENPQELNVPKVRYAPVENWKGFWITHPAIGVNDYNVVLFRKTF
ncbi:MAG: hypothetical protein MUD08_09645, partial [Cytophagales bacterium]|nr:hypothetical protein [Cytophagales bacterium]